MPQWCSRQTQSLFAQVFLPGFFQREPHYVLLHVARHDENAVHVAEDQIAWRDSPTYFHDTTKIHDHRTDPGVLREAPTTEYRPILLQDSWCIPMKAIDDRTGAATRFRGRSHYLTEGRTVLRTACRYIYFSGSIWSSASVSRPKGLAEGPVTSPTCTGIARPTIRIPGAIAPMG